MPPSDLAEDARDVMSADKAAVSRALNLVEDRRPEAHTRVTELLTALRNAPKAAGGHRVGLTGPPGVGKSTLTSALARAVRGRGRTVGVVAVDPSDSVQYGEYLATIARCGSCHTPTEGQVGRPIPGMDYAGGVEFNGPGGRQVSSNLTPHENGLGKMTRAAFIDMFKQHETPQTVTREGNTLMFWTSYAGMTEDDLGAIYDFFQTLDPVDSQPE